MIKFIIDSASDIDLEEANKLGVTLLPMEVRFDDEEFLDGVNLSHREFFEKLIESNNLPKTSQINEYRFEESIQSIYDEKDEIIIFTISSKLSGTYNSAKKASKKYKNVYVFDTLNAAIGERLLFTYALSLAKKGLSAAEILSQLQEKRDKVKLLAVLDTLKYLRKGGRINAAVAFAGEMLSIKPVIAVVNGEIKLMGKAIGSKKGNNLLMKLVEECGGIDFDLPYGTVYSGLSDELLQKYLEDSKAIWESYTKIVPKYMIGSTIGTHIGPGAIGVAFFAKK